MLVNRHASGALSRVVRKLALPNRTNVVISSLNGPLERWRSLDSRHRYPFFQCIPSNNGWGNVPENWRQGESFDRYLEIYYNPVVKQLIWKVIALNYFQNFVMLSRNWSGMEWWKDKDWFGRNLWKNFMCTMLAPSRNESSHSIKTWCNIWGKLTC